MAGPAPRRIARVLALVAALALMGAACSSSGNAVRSSSAAEDLTKDAHDREIVESGLLRITDFPVGWSTDLKEDASDEDPSKSIPECMRLQEINDAVSLGKADSPDFVAAQEAQASNNVEIYPDATKAGEMQALVLSPDAGSCLQQGLRLTLERELAGDPEMAALVRGVTVNGGPFDAGSFGDATAGLGYQAAVDLGVTVLNFSFDMIVVRVGRAQASYVFMDDVPAPVADIRSQLIQASVDRLRAAGA